MQYKKHGSKLAKSRNSWRSSTKIASLILLLSQFSLAASQSVCPAPEYSLASSNHYVNITSPNYPSAYPTGSNCRYRINAPLDHVVELSCRFEVFMDTCGRELLLLSRDGDLRFRDADRYCRSGVVRSVSYFRSIALAFFSTTATTSQRARFHCQAFARPQACLCGWSSTTRIANGREAVRHEYPSMVALRDVTSLQRVFCGGSIITHRHIVTAAHCMTAQPNAQNILAYVGDHDLSSSSDSSYEMQYRIQRIIAHPMYNSVSEQVENDIALLVTTKVIEWSRGVGPICLPFRQAADTFPYRNVDVAGWGTLSFAGPKSVTLQKVELLTMTNEACQRQYNATILRSQLCTYDYLGLAQDSCQYDSGGPVLLKEQRQLLLGIISYGRICGTRYAIGVNTRLTGHLNWLWNYVQGSVCIV